MFEVGDSCRLKFFDDKNQSHELYYDAQTQRAHLDGREEEGFLVEMSVPELDMVEDHHQDVHHPDIGQPPLVVPFSSQLCDDPSLTGGKGASLGKIISAARTFVRLISE